MSVRLGARRRRVRLVHEVLSNDAWWSLRGISSAGRAPALQAGGRRFDPVILHQTCLSFDASSLDADLDQCSSRGCRSLTIHRVESALATEMPLGGKGLGGSVLLSTF